jgi:fumarate reductase flavoprotein subunit
MVAAWCPLVEKADGSIYPNPAANTGDGINMALWAGGTIQSAAHAAMVHPVFCGGAMSTTSYMKVNGGATRFCNESTTLPGISNMYMTSPNRVVWSIFDSDFEAQIPTMSALSNYNNNTAGPLTKFFSEGTMDPANPGSPTEVVGLCIEDGTTVQADSIEALAAAIGVPSDALVKTVARYNELVDAGTDADFGKDPADLKPIRQGPFYASSLTAKLLVIASGLNVNDQMQVLDEEDKPIDGLYAVGNVMGNFFANDYPICAPGLSHGRCLTLGALIGTSVATDTPLQ